MLDAATQIGALAAALEGAGFAPLADPREGVIILQRLPGFREQPAFTLVITLDTPMARRWESLFEGCMLESGRMVRGAAHNSGIYSRKKRVERARQEKWVALWSLFDAGILTQEQRPVFNDWHEVPLP